MQNLPNTEMTDALTFVISVEICSNLCIRLAVIESHHLRRRQKNPAEDEMQTKVEYVTECQINPDSKK